MDASQGSSLANIPWEIPNIEPLSIHSDTVDSPRNNAHCGAQQFFQPNTNNLSREKTWKRVEDPGARRFDCFGATRSEAYSCCFWLVLGLFFSFFFFGFSVLLLRSITPSLHFPILCTFFWHCILTTCTVLLTNSVFFLYFFAVYLYARIHVGFLSKQRQREPEAGSREKYQDSYNV